MLDHTMTFKRPNNILSNLGKFSVIAGLIASSDIDQFSPCLVLQFMMDQEIIPESNLMWSDLIDNRI